MRAGGRSFGLCAALAIAMVASVRAATYKPLSDAELAARSPVVVRGQVVDVSVALEPFAGSEFPFTFVTLAVEERIKGEVGSTMVLRLPGGRIGALAWKLFGTPELAPGQDVVVLLNPVVDRPDTFDLSEFGLSLFDILRDEKGNLFATRPAFPADEDLYLSKRTVQLSERASGGLHAPLRDANSFLCALRSEAAGQSVGPVAYAQPVGALSALPVFSLNPEWVNIGGPENGSNNLFKWFWPSPSPNGIVTTSGTQSNLSDGTDGSADVAAMVSQWHGVAASDVRYSSGPGGNVVVNLDVASVSGGWATPLACGSGGVIGLGGPGSSSFFGTFKGDSPYFATPSGNVWIRQQTGSPGCYPVVEFKSDALHEMGHSLGLGHPDQSASIHSSLCGTPPGTPNCPAVMNSILQGFTTPQTDDIEAIQWYYGTGGGAPVASFSFSAPPNFAGASVSFTDTSTGSPTSWAWNFGDPSSGASNTSTLQNPTHTFASGGSYTVSLTATNGSGSSSPVTHSVVITGPPVANFSFAPPSPVTGQTVTFTDSSTNSPSSWSWNFGDPSSGAGNTSTLKNPTHSFSAANTYTVTLTSSNGAGASTPVVKSVVVTNPVAPTAAFSFSPPSPVVGQAVFFTDASTGAPTSWSWNFGDSTASSAQNPAKAYAGPGTFTVTLTVMNAQGSNSVSHPVTVSSVGSAPTANFTFSPPSPQPGQTVTFTDTSTGGPTSWAWTFGDGGSSTLENPSHAYAGVGTFTISLTAHNALGTSQSSHSVTVTSVAAPQAAFTFSPSPPQPDQTIAFVDASSGGPTAWTWDFGDGNGSSARNPSHAYFSAGTYTVKLTVSNTAGVSQVSRSVAVTVPTPCPADPGTLPANAGDNFCLTLFAQDPRTGHTGPGLAIPQNNHFGYFSIPAITDDPGNPEVFVKVLDGRAINGFFWVFYGGLTDLQYTITVKDFQTGLSRQYTKPAGSSAGGFDTQAFSGASSATVERSPDERTDPSSLPAIPVVDAACTGDLSTLCLDAAHGFTLTLAAVDQRTSRTGNGQAIPQSDVFGYFSIPAITNDPTNPEVFVKVLDGRAINGHFWVFYGGLTDLQYTITVREVLTGKIKTYFKPMGSASGGFDVLAF